MAEKTSILIVEDDRDTRDLVRASLEGDLDYRLYEAGDGRAAFDAACAVRPDIVLVDFGLPGDMDGVQLCAALRADARTAGARLMALTACVDRERAQRAGCTGYLSKPFSPSALLSALKALPPAA